MNSPELSLHRKVTKVATRIAGTFVVGAGLLSGGGQAVEAVHAAGAGNNTAPQIEAGNYTCDDLMNPNKPATVRGVNPDGSRKYYGKIQDPYYEIYCVTDNTDGSASLTHGPQPANTTIYKASK